MKFSRFSAVLSTAVRQGVEHLLSQHILLILSSTFWHFSKLSIAALFRFRIYFRQLIYITIFNGNCQQVFSILFLKFRAHFRAEHSVIKLKQAAIFPTACLYYHYFRLMSIAFFDFFRKKPEKFSQLCKGMVLPLFQFAKNIVHELDNAVRNLVFNREFDSCISKKPL